MDTGAQREITVIWQPETGNQSIKTNLYSAMCRKRIRGAWRPTQR